MNRCRSERLDIFIEFDGVKTKKFFTYLIEEMFEDYYIPQSILLEYENNRENTVLHRFGIDREHIDPFEGDRFGAQGKKESSVIQVNTITDTFHEEETLDSDMGFTRLSPPSCGKEFLDQINESIQSNYSLVINGSLKTYYQKGDYIESGFYFRDKLDGKFSPLMGFAMQKSGTKSPISEHYLNITCFPSIFLDNRDGTPNERAAHRNRNVLMQKIRALIDQFRDSYIHSYGISGSAHNTGFENGFQGIKGFQGFNR